MDLLFGVAARTLSSRLKVRNEVTLQKVLVVYFACLFMPVFVCLFVCLQEISVGIVGNMACLPQVCSQCMCELPHM